MYWREINDSLRWERDFLNKVAQLRGTVHIRFAVESTEIDKRSWF